MKTTFTDIMLNPGLVSWLALLLITLMLCIMMLLIVNHSSKNKITTERHKTRLLCVDILFGIIAYKGKQTEGGPDLPSWSLVLKGYATVTDEKRFVTIESLHLKEHPSKVDKTYIPQNIILYKRPNSNLYEPISELDDQEVFLLTEFLKCTI